MTSINDLSRLDKPEPIIVDLSRVSRMPRARDSRAYPHCNGEGYIYLEEDSGTPADTIPHILEEIKANRELYKDYHDSSKPDKEQPGTVSMMMFPTCCMQNIDRIRHLCNPLRAPVSKHTVAAALIHWGLVGLKTIPLVDNLHDVQKDLIIDVPQSTDKHTLEALQETILSNFKVSNGLSGGQFKPQIPRGIFNRLALYAQDLGMKTHELAVVCICLCLYFQPETFEAHRADLREHVDRFLLQAKLRLRMAEAFRDHIHGIVTLDENGEWWRRGE